MKKSEKLGNVLQFFQKNAMQVTVNLRFALIDLINACNFYRLCQILLRKS